MNLELKVKSEELRVNNNVAKQLRNSSLFILHFSLLFLMTCPAFAAEEPKISVKAEVSSAFITIGDPVTYTLQIQHVPEIKILSEVKPPDPSILRVKKSEKIEKKEGNRIYEGKKFIVTAFSLGEYVLEPQTVEYLDTDGQKKTLQTDKIYLTVKSVAEGEEKTDIRGVKPVVPLPKKLLKWLSWAGIALAALIIILFLLTRKKAVPAAPEETPKTLEQETMYQLNQLFDSNLIRDGKFKEYYLRLSDILRGFFERRFHVQATEATTFELQRMLKAKDVDQGLREEINEVLEAADLAKFAKWKPEPAQIIHIQQKAKQVVEKSRPQDTTGGI